MTKLLKPWATRPFELIFHAEVHYRSGTDYDRRLALISFDNSIEVAITTYLSLNPIQRDNRQYKKTDVEKWVNNYHSKIDFFVEEIQKRGLPAYKEKAEIVWYHDQRNDQYHGDGFGVPSKDVLDNIRQVAFWVFSVLFDSNVEMNLDSVISQSEVSIPSIPDVYVVPKAPDVSQRRFEQNQIPALVIASILGSWDEKNDGDQQIIRRLANGF